MEPLEMIEKLMDKANVTYEEAKEALETCNWDILDALLYLEKAGKAQAPEEAVYTTKVEEDEEPAKEEDPKSYGSETVVNTLKKLGAWCIRMIQIGNRNFLKISHKEREVIDLPLTVAVIAVLAAPPFVLGLAIVGVFCECRYSFYGPEIKKDTKKENEAADKTVSE